MGSVRRVSKTYANLFLGTNDTRSVRHTTRHAQRKFLLEVSSISNYILGPTSLKTPYFCPEYQISSQIYNFLDYFSNGISKTKNSDGLQHKIGVKESNGDVVSDLVRPPSGRVLLSAIKHRCKIVVKFQTCSWRKKVGKH